MAERLEEMESVLREHSTALDQLRAANTMSAHTISAATPDTHFSQAQNSHFSNACLASPLGSGVSPQTTTTVSGRSGISRAVNTAPEATLPPMTIPLWHSTTTGSLLSCPLVRSLLGDYADDVFLRIEERRILPSHLKLACSSGIAPNIPILDRAITDNLMEMYFQTINIQHPVISYEDGLAHYHSVVAEPLQSSFQPSFQPSFQAPSQPSLQSSLVLAMLALAKAATTQPSEKLDSDWSPGSGYLLPASTITLDAYFNAAVITPDLPRCLYLIALYYNYLARPLDAWKLVHMASTSFQRLWIR